MKTIRRIVPLVVMLTLVFMLPVSSEASSSKKKTIYVPTKISSTQYFDDGEKYASYSETITYGKNGMPSKLKSKFYTITYLYDKKGRLKGIYKTTKYDGNTKYDVAVNKNGLPVSLTGMNDQSGTRISTSRKFRADGTLASIVEYLGNDTIVYRYDKYGNVTYYDWYQDMQLCAAQERFLKCDKRGNVKTAKIIKTSDVGQGELYHKNEKWKIRNSYDKHGNLKKKVAVVNGGMKYVTKYKYKKVKVKRKHLKYLRYFKKTQIMDFEGCMF